jgi:hypothetical protein
MTSSLTAEVAPLAAPRATRWAAPQAMRQARENGRIPHRHCLSAGSKIPGSQRYLRVRS